MAEIVNLKQHRKRKARAEKGASADANRVKHGTPKRLRDQKKRDDEQAARHIDAHKLDDEES